MAEDLELCVLNEANSHMRQERKEVHGAAQWILANET